MLTKYKFRLWEFMLCFVLISHPLLARQSSAFADHPQKLRGGGNSTFSDQPGNERLNALVRAYVSRGFMGAVLVARGGRILLA